jgi:TRAP-type C4-dicarboxylate transport system permease small subunit
MISTTEAAPRFAAAPRRPDLHRLGKSFGYAAANGFGYALLVLALLVTIETLGRKLFDFSLQGADELGGYILAAGSALCFSTALAERGHIRIDLFHAMLPRWLRIALDWLSIVLMATFGVLIAWLAWKQLADSLDYHSTAPTPWATPLAWPMGVWVAALAAFAVMALAFAVDATRLLLLGRTREIEKRYGPKEAIEEVREELADLQRR